MKSTESDVCYFEVDAVFNREPVELGFELLASCDSLKYHISMFSFDFNTSTMVKVVIFIVIVLHGSVVV